ncbi:MAG TPA: ATP-binding cassette domain-containing protein, partial [Chitinophagaceae bacterium]|nr:ATP-binding cassette domain-containing protein [Chitinophagaceae bacterium]
IYELITEMPEIKINNAHGNKIDQWLGLQTKLNTIKIRALFLNYYQLIGSNFFNRVKDIVITGICAYAVIHGNMTLGVMMTIGYILGQLNGPIDNIIAIIRGLQDAKLSYNRLEDIQRLKDETEGRSIRLKHAPELSIDLANVSFKYEGSHCPLVLRNVDVSIPVGKITAIVGSSGSGKTTLLKLLLGIYEPTDGKIMLDDVNLSAVIPDTWRNRCGVVLQDGFIYSNTYAENIALADKAPDMEKVKYAAELACISEFIESLPLGYHTRIGKAGVSLSGGQKQRILIARAIYRNPEFIFFDEATSSLDANNEMKILRNLEQFFKGKTVVIIAHRLSTVRNADQIIVLEKGQIVERNNHEGLIRAKGRYFDLVRNQLELGS